MRYTARQCISTDGSFRDARFELDEPHVVKHFDEHSWAWNDNPFVGTRELNGLKIVMMLLSNWDNKDVRDVARGSNTAINDQFILGTNGDSVQWGYKGQRTADAVADVIRSDVQWIYKYLGGITDEQLAAGLRASGATETEIADFTASLREAQPPG
jgi:hypothetical protein